MEDSSLACAFTCGIIMAYLRRRKLAPADLTEYFVRIVILLFLRQGIDQGQQFLTDYDQRLHFLQRVYRPGLEIAATHSYS